MINSMYEGMVGLPHFSVDKVIEEIKGLGITHVVYLTDFMTGFIVDKLLEECPHITMISVCREGEALAVAAGLWMAGETPLVAHQNSGLLDSGDTITGVAVELQTPILMLIGHRGFLHDRSIQRLDAPGVHTEDVLTAMDIPFELLETDADISVIKKMQTEAIKRNRPTAVLVCWESNLIANVEEAAQ